LNLTKNIKFGIQINNEYEELFVRCSKQLSYDCKRSLKQKKYDFTQLN
jgi:hypothetical protein